MKKLVFALALSVFGFTAYSQTTPAPAQEAPKAEHKMHKKGEGKMHKDGDHKKAHDQAKGKEAMAKAGKMYACPMKCTPPSKTAGKCPKCNMDLVEVAPKAKAKTMAKPKEMQKPAETH